MAPILRRSPLVLATSLVAVVVSALVASPASADVPEGWPAPGDVDALYALLVLAGIPVLLFVLIGLAVYVPAMVRGERVAPGHGEEHHEWFGGRREGAPELESADQGTRQQAGGGSGSW